MITFKTTYKGKSYDDITEAFNVAIIDTIAEGMKEIVKQRLDSVIGEIEKHDGEIIINVNEDYTASGIITNVPEELIEICQKLLNDDQEN